MKKLKKKIINWLLSWASFWVALFWVVYAANIITVTTQTISTWDSIWAGWYQSVNDKLLDVYSKGETYSKTEVYNSSQTYTKAEVDALITQATLKVWSVQSLPWLSCKDIKNNWWNNWDWIYWIKPTWVSIAYEVYCDMITDWWGWTLILNYLHKWWTNPDLSVLTDSAPIYNWETLWMDQSWTNAWWHMWNTTVSKIDFTETQWYCKTWFHSRVIHFKNSSSNVNSYIKTGNWSMDIYNSSTHLSKYNNASLPHNYNWDWAYSNKWDFAMTEFPYYWDSTISHPRAHWGIKWETNRWECDDYPWIQWSVSRYWENTFHQIYIR